MASKPLWESAFVNMVAGGLLAAFAGYCTAKVTADTQIQTAKITSRTEVKIARLEAAAEANLAHRAAAIEQRERRKATARDFINACSSLAVGMYQAAQSKTAAEMTMAMIDLPQKNTAYLVAVAAISTDFPEVTGTELPKNSTVGPAGPIEPLDDSGMAQFRSSLLQRVVALDSGCEKVGNWLLVALRGEYTKHYEPDP